MSPEELRKLARSLRAIDPGLLKRGTGTGRRRAWYQGNEPYFDVFIDLDDDEGVVWAQLTLRGRCVTLERSRSRVMTGKTNENEIVDDAHPQSKLIVHDAHLDASFLEATLSLLDERADDPDLTRFAAAIRELSVTNS